MHSNPPPLRQLLDVLIETPSVSSTDPRLDMSNRPVIDLLAEWLDGLGFRIDVTGVADSPGKANLVATLGSGEDGLVLSGHTDTVPFDEDQWSTDPFRLTERDGRLYGLGTSDMKSFLGLVVEVVRDLDSSSLRQPVVVVATADEETGMGGIKSLMDRGERLGRHTVIGEPTNLEPVRMHKGMLMEAVRVHGHSGHSSDPRLGRNALEGMHRVVTALLAWREELQSRFRNPLFSVSAPTMNLGHIHGGDNPNRICGDCELHLDLRPLPGMSLADLREQLRDRARKAVAGTALEISFRVLFDGMPAMETPARAEIVRAAEQLTGQAAGAVAFGTEGPYLNNLGMETVILGPGDIHQAHQPDEYLELDRIAPTLDLLRGFIRRFCIETVQSSRATSDAP